MRILLIDDDREARLLAALVLRAELPRAAIAEAGTALEYAERLAEGDISAAIAAERLAWANGRETLDAIARRYPRCLTVLLVEPRQAPGTRAALGRHRVLERDSAGLLALPALLSEAASPPSSVQRTERLPVGYFALDEHGGIVEANPAFARLCGTQTPGELLGSPLAARLDPAAARERLLAALGERQAVQALALRLKAGAESVPVRLSLQPIPPDAGEPAFAEGVAWPDPAPEEGGLASAEPNAPAPAPTVRPAPADRLAPTVLDEPAGGEGAPHGEAPYSGPPYSAEGVPPHKATPANVVSGTDFGLGRPSRGVRAIPTESAGARVSHADFSRARDRVRRALEAPAAPLGVAEAIVPTRTAVDLAEAALEAMRRLEGAILSRHARIWASRLPALLVDREDMVGLFHALLDNALARSRGAPRITVRASPHEDGWLLSVGDDGEPIAESAFANRFGLVREVARRYGGRVWTESKTGGSNTVCVTLDAPAVEPARVELAVRYNGQPVGRVSVANASNKLEITRAALALPELNRALGDRTIKDVQRIGAGIVDIVA